MARISCIIPVYNAERFVAAAIQSVLDQTRAADEIIVVDDGSKDHSQERIATFGDKVRYLRQPNRGAVAARNHGIRHASGDYLAFLDADDLWRPGKLALQVARFESNPHLGGCTTFMQNFWMSEVADESARVDRMKAPQPGVASTLVVSSRTLHDIGAFDEALSHRDVQEWIVRARNKGWEVDTLADVTVDRRIHADNLSRNRDSDDELLRLAIASIARKRRAPES